MHIRDHGRQRWPWAGKVCGESGEEEEAEFEACQLEDTGAGGGVARQQEWAVESVGMSSSVSPPGAAGAERCRYILQSGDRKAPAGLEAQKVRSLVYIGSKPLPDLLSIDKLTWDPAGLAVAPYLPCAPAGQALVSNAPAQSLRPRWGAIFNLFQISWA